MFFSSYIFLIRWWIDGIFINSKKERNISLWEKYKKKIVRKTCEVNRYVWEARDERTNL
jgi:hypothetical protein